MHQSHMCTALWDSLICARGPCATTKQCEWGSLAAWRRDPESLGMGMDLLGKLSPISEVLNNRQTPLTLQAFLLGFQHQASPKVGERNLAIE